MKNILLVCAAGMSTSMLVKRMQEHAAASGIAVNINALAILKPKKNQKKRSGCGFIRAAGRFQKSEIEEVAHGKMPVAVIDMKYYGQMDGPAVLDSALTLLANK